MAILKRISISGYKSIEKADIELRPMNVLIGANGAGKSNLISLFKLAYEMRQGRLQRFVLDWGADALFFYGTKTTERIEVNFCFHDSDFGYFIYRVRLGATRGSSVTLQEDLPLVHGAELPATVTPDEMIHVPDAQVWRSGGGILPESQFEDHVDIWRRDPAPRSQAAARAGELAARSIQGWGIYQFADTSAFAGIRRRCYQGDNLKLHTDGSNLAAFLFKLQAVGGTPYNRIVQTIRLIAPWFGDFVLEPIKPNETDVQLNWRDRYSDTVFGPHQLPDGALRAMALIALLLQPQEDMPSLIVIDEPELGLHPAATTIVTGLLRAASLRSQVVVATQSPSFLDEFDPADVIVVDREDGRSRFTPQSPEQLHDWLQDYSLGELWQRNVIGGGPF
jgi:predicted ATPase